MRVATAFVACLLLGFAAAAHAHQTRLSSSRLTLEGAGANVILELNGADLEAATGAKITAADGIVTRERLAAEAGVVLGYVEKRARLGFAGGADCARAGTTLRASGDHVLVETKFRCPPTGREREYRVTLFHEIDPAARHMASVEGTQRRLAFLGAGNPALSLSPAAGGAGETLAHYILAGVEHIAIGYDHVAFLLAVILPGGGFWPLFAAITAFTVAHSITLSLAVLGVVAPPAAAVEALIAASIVYAAGENLLARELRRRWRLTLAFGLVHGFGFAAVLRDYGLPEDALALALAAFNIGVELGQLAVVAAAIGLWRAVVVLRGSDGIAAPARRRFVQAASAALLALGLYWLGERLLA